MHRARDGQEQLFELYERGETFQLRFKIYDNLALFFHSGKKEHRFYQQHFWNCPFFQQLRYQVHHDRTFYIYSD